MINQLKALRNEIWEAEKYYYCNKRVYKVKRRLTGIELKFIYHAIIKCKLIVVLYTAGNRGIGMSIYIPDLTFDESSYPGVVCSKKDTTHVINIWEKHVFEDNPPEYKFRTWCKNKGYYDLERKYKFFKAFADRPDNIELMRRYNFAKPYIQPLSYFEY